MDAIREHRIDEHFQLFILTAESQNCHINFKAPEGRGP